MWEKCFSLVSRLATQFVELLASIMRQSVPWQRKPLERAHVGNGKLSKRWNQIFVLRLSANNLVAWHWHGMDYDNEVSKHGKFNRYEVEKLAGGKKFALNRWGWRGHFTSNLFLFPLTKSIKLCQSRVPINRLVVFRIALTSATLSDRQHLVNLVVYYICVASGLGVSLSSWIRETPWVVISTAIASAYKSDKEGKAPHAAPLLHVTSGIASAVCSVRLDELLAVSLHLISARYHD